SIPRTPPAAHTRTSYLRSTRYRPIHTTRLSFSIASSPPACYPPSLHDALPISLYRRVLGQGGAILWQHTPKPEQVMRPATAQTRSEEHTSELQSRVDIVCRLLLE